MKLSAIAKKVEEIDADVKDTPKDHSRLRKKIGRKS